MGRGMKGSKAEIVNHLQDVGYYRLSGYWHIFKDENGDFRPGTNLADIWNITCSTGSHTPKNRIREL